MPSAGPYAYSRNDVNQLTSIRRNPFWKAGPGRTRSRNLDGVDLKWNLNEQAAFNQVKTSELDQGPLPAAEVQGVANQYGVNKTRFWTKVSNCTGYLPMNTADDLFKDNTDAEGRFNWHRPDGLLESGRPIRRSTVDAPLQPGRARSIARNLYPITRTWPRRGHSLPGTSRTEDHRLLPLVRNDQPGPGPDRPPGPHQPRLPAGQHHDEGLLRRRHLHRMGSRGTDADIGVSMGWCSDYPATRSSFLVARLQNPISRR